MDPVVERSRSMIREGSRSFAGASRLIAPATRESVHMLYAWCRHCDDVIDSQDLGRDAPAPAGSARERLDRLEVDTRRALAGETMESPVFVALQRVVRRHEIPQRHPLELLQGFAMDVEGRQYRCLDDTLGYCYHVAGVVGVMMAYVMGARDSDPLDRAADLGLALQLTNIARDVMDDATAGRVYLPLDWLDEAGVDAERILEPRYREGVFNVTRRVLLEADRYYGSATQGLSSLSLRSAWAVATASRVYRGIGRVVLRRGPAAWDTRAYVSRKRKLGHAALAWFEAFGAVSLRRQSSPAPREGLWTRPRQR